MAFPPYGSAEVMKYHRPLGYGGYDCMEAPSVHLDLVHEKATIVFIIAKWLADKATDMDEPGVEGYPGYRYHFESLDELLASSHHQP